MLDVTTLRIALGVVSLTVLVLFWAAVYRPTRSPFAGWWTMSLAWSTLSPLLLLFNGTPAQVVLNPASNVIAVWAGVSVWWATRSLRGSRVPVWVMPVASLAALLAAVADDPSRNVWAGNGVLFALMGLFFGLGAWDMWSAWRSRRAAPDRRDQQEALMALVVSSLAASLLAAYYLVRLVLFLAGGPTSEAFTSVAGAGATTIVLLVVLVAVTFSVSALGYDQRTQELRRRATRDDLTGILGRTAWVDGAGRLFATGRGIVVVVADVDHFKAINDTHGHAVGDAVLMTFADSVREAMDPGAVVGRMGGEEFAVAVPGENVTETAARLDRLATRFAWRLRTDRLPSTTVSFGVAKGTGAEALGPTIERADAAMYRAKAAGRARVVIDGDD
ncbi:diguanylate cyclase [Demequina sp. NBRC 110057]|uniref:GGDEF domain-containing protein n=1 Tax=Demequina sp. NBRC 110057 TaxID=1570346 RepID=UPI0009FF5682|nr:GGDEF domain-containing protein [Demequina sp. NBRC 110057]